MTAGIIIGTVVLFIVGWAIVRGKYAPLVLFLSGVFMLICSVALGTGNFMPKQAVATDNAYLNIIEFIRYMFSNRFASLGLIIMFMVGFASYMTHIGANHAFVSIATKRFARIKNPYVMIFVAFAMAKLISMVITSAVGAWRTMSCAARTRTHLAWTKQAHRRFDLRDVVSRLNGTHRRIDRRRGEGHAT